jgi:micrococcal nuclease
MRVNGLFNDVAQRTLIAIIGAATIAWSPQASWSMQTDYIERVVDGDTVILEKLGRARLLGINTPETVSPAQRERGEPPQCFGPEASAEMKRLLPAGTEVEFDTDVEPLDRFGRSLVYLYKDGESINELLVRKGFARAKAYKPNIRNQEMFNRLQAEAKSESLGLWGACFDAGSSGSSSGSSGGSSGGRSSTAGKGFGPNANQRPASTKTASAKLQQQQRSTAREAKEVAAFEANPGDVKDCADFDSYDEAKAWFDRYYPAYGDVAKLDGDGDLKPCEALIKHS